MQVMVAEKAERFARRRAVAAIIMGIVLGATQTQRMDDSGAGPLSWIITGCIIILFIFWASGIGHNAVFRGILNDESSDASRRRSLMIGFFNMLATAVVCYILSYVTDASPRDAIQIIMTVGISSALISFGAAERVLARQ